MIFIPTNNPFQTPNFLKDLTKNPMKEGNGKIAER